MCLFLCQYNIGGFFFKDFIYLFVRERERERLSKQEEQQAEGEAGSLLSKEADAGLHPRTLGP